MEWPRNRAKMTILNSMFRSCIYPFRGKKILFGCIVCVQLYCLVYFGFLFSPSPRGYLLAPSRSLLDGFNSSSSHHVQPTLLVGVFITNKTSSSRLNSFRRSFDIARSLVRFNLRHFFVLGDTTIEDNHSDILRLPIPENMDEGKTFHYFRAAIDWFSRQNIPFHPLNGIVKMDTDTAVDWPEFSNHVLARLQPMYYLGRLNSRAMCGNLDHCPPSHCRDFSNGCWVYMSGGWYALSLDLAKRSILNCSYSASHVIGYEDLTVGTWISRCSSTAAVFHVENGDFFCHSSFILDHHVHEMQFPKQNWLFFNRVRCLGSSGDVK